MQTIVYEASTIYTAAAIVVVVHSNIVRVSTGTGRTSADKVHYQLYRESVVHYAFERNDLGQARINRYPD